MKSDRELEWEIATKHHDFLPRSFVTVAVWDKLSKEAFGRHPSIVEVLLLDSPNTTHSVFDAWEALCMAMTPEGRLKKKVKALLNERGAFSYMPVQNGMGVVGIPDFVCCYKGLLIGIETKAPLKNPTSAEQRWKKATPNQQNRIQEIRDAGGLAEVVDDISQVEEMLRVADVRAVLVQGTHKPGGLFA